MEKKWILISGMMHAALLLAVAAAPHPGYKPALIMFEVDLVSYTLGDRTSGDEPYTTSGKPSAQVPVKNVARQEAAPVPMQTVKATYEYSALSMEEQESETYKTQETLSQKKTSAMARESTVEVDDRVTSAEITRNAIAKDTLYSTTQEGSHLFAGGSVSQLQTSNVKRQTSLLAFSGDPSSLGGILSGVPGGGPVRPEIISLPEPAYPALSRRLGEEGRVVIKARISAEGGVLSTKVIESSSHTRLDKAALQALKRAVFQPVSSYGIPLSSERTVAYTFRLEE
jgi:TonB family protein